MTDILVYNVICGGPNVGIWFHDIIGIDVGWKATLLISCSFD